MAVGNQALGHSSITPCVRYDAPGSQHTQAACVAKDAPAALCKDLRQRVTLTVGADSYSWALSGHGAREQSTTTSAQMAHVVCERQAGKWRDLMSELAEGTLRLQGDLPPLAAEDQDGSPEKELSEQFSPQG